MSLESDLIRDEGLVLKPYRCTANKLTIGVGRNLDDNGLRYNEILSLINGDKSRKQRFSLVLNKVPKDELEDIMIQDFIDFGISKEEALFLLRNDIEDCKKALSSYLPWTDKAPDELKEILLNMTFNMGIGKLLTFKNTLKYMQEGNYKLASENMLKSKWARQVGMRAVRLSDRVKTLQK